MAAGAANESWGELGPAMRILPNERWREFVRQLVTGKPGRGSVARAYRAAGLGTNSTPLNVARDSYKLSHDERIIAAIAEESRRALRVGHPEAVQALLAMVRSPEHKGHERAVLAIVDRTDPVVSRHEVDVTHRVVDPDQEAIEELRALRKLGTPRDKLLELYGPNGLDRIEALEAVEAARRASAAKVIDGKAVEIPRTEAPPASQGEPDPEMLGEDL